MKRSPTVTWEIHKRVPSGDLKTWKWKVTSFGCSELAARSVYGEMDQPHLAPVQLVKATTHREVIAGMKFHKKGESPQSVSQPER